MRRSLQRMSGNGNVLFVTVDQWRGDCLSALRHPIVQTPNLDALARRGVLFANHWANTAPCGPSRATLHTGLYAQNHRSVLNGTPLDDRFTNMAREAKGLGYEPTLFGYTDTSIDPRTVDDPADPRRFSYEGVLPGYAVAVNDPDFRHWGAWLAAQGVDVPSRPDHLYRPQIGFPGADKHGETWAPTQFTAEQTETAFLVDQMQQWFERRRDEPFFVHASFIRPHPPYRNPVGYHDRYDADEGKPFRGFARRDDQKAQHALPGVALDVPGIGCPTDDRDRRQQRATYYGMIAEVDDQLGRLFDWLGTNGHLDDTLVVLTSDHGEMAGDHWFVDKLGYWDESYHVPLIAVDPRAAADATRGTVVRHVTEHVDVMPTICAWLGIDVPPACDGRALQPFLHDGAPADWRTDAHWEWDFRSPGERLVEQLFGVTSEECCLNVVHDGRWKYVHFATVDQTVFPPLLFDLHHDPDQLVNVAADPASSGAANERLSSLLSWRMRHDERTLTGHFIGSQGLVVDYGPRR